MPGTLFRIAERSALAVLPLLGFAVTIADTLDLFTFAPDAIPRITLLALSSVTLVLLFEVGRFRKLDKIEASLANLDIDGIAAQLRKDHYAGVVAVHRKFSEDLYGGYVAKATSVTILNTWIPNLDLLRDDLELALRRRAEVRVLLLHPKSMATSLRARALSERGVDKVTPSVQDGIVNCIKVLHAMHHALDEQRRTGLKVRIYNSLPAVSVYQADERLLVGMFMHGQLAIESAQFEIEGQDTQLGRQIRKELDILWEIGREIDLADWQREIDIAI